MELSDLLSVKKFLDYYGYELPIGVIAIDDLCAFVDDLIKEQSQVHHMNDEDLSLFVSKKVDAYFEKNNRVIDPFGNGNTETISEASIELRKQSMIKEIKDNRDDYNIVHGKKVFTHYLGGACAVSEEYWSFQYKILNAYYKAINVEFEARC
jgi:hypothetical protein